MIILSILQIEEAKMFLYYRCDKSKINGYENNEIFLLDEEDREIKIDKKYVYLHQIYLIQIIILRK